MFVLKAEQAARMQKRKNEEREAKERMLVSDIYIVWSCMIVLFCCSEFHMVVLKAKHAARIQRWKDEKPKANEHMLVNDIYIYIYIYIYICLDQKIFVAFSATYLFYFVVLNSI
jgi:hypothetical protein